MKAKCICVDYINCNPEPIPNPDCAIHGKLSRKNKPNPGSIEALDMGCSCPRMDNNFGEGNNGEFWISANCHLHNPNPEDDKAYLCTQCGFMATSVERLDDHLLSKHKVIPYHGKDE